MASYLPYPRYKSSGNSWLGDMPEHWTPRRSDFVVDTNRQQVSAESLNDTEVIHYSIPNVQEYGAGVVESGDKVDSSKLKIDAEQLLVSKLNPRKATLCIAKPDETYMVIASSEFVPVLPGKAILRYAYYVWGSDKVTGLLSGMVQSVTRSHQRVNPTDILKLHWAWPPHDEQQSITRFLDFKTAQIDALIAKKKALLDKLAEKRMALISHAVTKGLDPSVPMKDSGVAWLGDIPAHWDVIALRYACEFLNRKRIPLSAEERGAMADRIFPYYGASGIIDYVENYIFDQKTILIAEDGANLLSRSSPLAFIADGKYWVNNHAHILNPKRGPFEYWADLLCTIKYDPWITGSAQPKLSKENLGSIKLPLPPEYEQSAIIKYIAEHSGEIDLMATKVREVIDRLDEYRSALITNAVTGKIDVRGFQIPSTSTTQELTHA